MINRFSFYLFIRFYEWINSRIIAPHSREEGGALATISVAGLVSVTFTNIMKAISLFLFPSALDAIFSCSLFVTIAFIIVFWYFLFDFDRTEAVYQDCRSIGKTKRTILTIICVFYMIATFAIMIILTDATREYQRSNGPEYIKPFVEKVLR